ncbi:MAG: PaaI family thioesterase [Sneathiellaceae bacterium]
MPMFTTRLLTDHFPPELLEHGDGYALLGFTLGHEHMNAGQSCHGGLVATMLDTALTVAASMGADPTERRYGITLSMTVNYVAPARVGPVRCTGRRIGGGRRTVFTEGELRDLDGTLLATASAPVKVIDYPQDSLRELQGKMDGGAG